MSGDSIKPEEGGEVEVINPDAGNNEIEAQPEDGDAMTAAESDAVKDYESSIDNETTEPETEPEQAAEDLQAEPDETEPEAQDEVEAERPKSVWDGNPDNLPEELAPTYQSMLRGFHQKTRELAAEKKKFEELQTQLLLKVSDGPKAKSEVVEGPPPLPTGDNITQEQWNEAVTEQNAWHAEQARLKNLKELQESGKFAPAETVARLLQEKYVTDVTAKVTALPGYSPDVEQLMLHTMANNPFWAQAPNSEEGMMELARVAIAEVNAKGVTTAAAEKTTAKIKKQAAASSNATPRFSTPKGASPEDVFAKKGFKTEDEKMAYSEKLALESIGG